MSGRDEPTAVTPATKAIKAALIEDLMTMVVVLCKNVTDRCGYCVRYCLSLSLVAGGAFVCRLSS